MLTPMCLSLLMHKLVEKMNILSKMMTSCNQTISFLIWHKDSLASSSIRDVTSKNLDEELVNDGPSLHIRILIYSKIPKSLHYVD